MSGEWDISRKKDKAERTTGVSRARKSRKKGTKAERTTAVSRTRQSGKKKRDKAERTTGVRRTRQETEMWNPMITCESHLA